jgi:hypothetical protein
LQKKTTQAFVDVKAIRYWKDEGVERLGVLESSASDLEPVDSLETGSILYALKVKGNMRLIEQPDSAALALSVAVVRDGKKVRSFLPDRWKTVSVSSLSSFSVDILTFSLPERIDLSLAYEEVWLKEADGSIPEDIVIEMLQQATQTVGVYPNPFNPTTTFRIVLPNATHISLRVYNVLGQEVAKLVNGEMEAGEHSIPFGGSHYASGVHLYRLVLNGKVQSGRILLLK